MKGVILNILLQTAPHNGLPAKVSNLHTYLTKVHIYVNDMISDIKMTSPHVIVYRQDSQNA